MASNRILYLGVLVLCATFYFASSIWFSWVLLVLVVAMPVLSFLISLPAMLSCRLIRQMPNVVEQSESTCMYLRLSALSLLPLPEIRIRLKLRSRDQEEQRFLSHLSRTEGILSLPTESCGFLEAYFFRGWVYDALGLFRLPMRLPKSTKMAILPAPRQPASMPLFEQLLQPQMKPKPGGGYAEQHDHRVYRPGDPVKSIHWKLSVKTDELIVREPLEPIHRKILLAICTPRGPENRENTLGTFRYLSDWLLQHGFAHEAVWMDGTQLQSAEIHTEQDSRNALCAACLVPESSLNLPFPLPLQADFICPIGQEGGSGQ